MSKTDRQFAIQKILKSGPKTASELNAALRDSGFEASDRTLQRDQTEMLLRGDILFCNPTNGQLTTDSVANV